MRHASTKVEYDEEFDVYAPSQTVNPTNLNVVTGAMTFVTRIKGSLLRQTQHSINAVMALGIMGVLSGDFFTDIDNADSVGDRYVLVDKYGSKWIIHGPPANRPRFPLTAHVKALVSELQIKPVGIP